VSIGERVNVTEPSYHAKASLTAAREDERVKDDDEGVWKSKQSSNHQKNDAHASTYSDTCMGKQYNLCSKLVSVCLDDSCSVGRRQLTTTESRLNRASVRVRRIKSSTKPP